MAYIYDRRKRSQGQQNTDPEPAAAPGPSMDALMNGTARPTAAQKGRSIDLDGAIKAKMEHAFGDLSAVKLYESRAVGEAGAEAVAQGSEIAFAPGMADFSTRSGQERLGHELSHVMSQRSGQVRGQGFLANSALEARADREGAMAAAGEQVYTGPVTHALSDASPSPSVAGPMQATREDEENVAALQPSPNLVSPQIKASEPALDLTGPRVPPIDLSRLPEGRPKVRPSEPARDLKGPRVPPIDLSSLPEGDNRNLILGDEEAPGKKAAPKPKKQSAPKKKAAPKPKKKSGPVRASYRDLEDVRDYDEDTKRISIYDDEASELREDEDAIIVSPEMLRGYQSRNNKLADELFHVGAGVLADDIREGIEKQKIIDAMNPIFYEEELKKGTPNAKDEADDRARDYAKKNKPKFDPTITKQERKWFDNNTRDPSLDLYRTLYNRKMKAAQDLIAYRENMGKLRPGEDQDKLDFEASFSESARNLSVYDMILSSMTMTPASMELQKEKLAKGESQNDYDTIDRALKLTTASSTGKHVQTEAGKADLPLLQQMNIKGLQATYQSRSELRKKKKKK